MSPNIPAFRPGEQGDGLAPDTRYFNRLVFAPSGGAPGTSPALLGPLLLTVSRPTEQLLGPGVPSAPVSIGRATTR